MELTKKEKSDAFKESFGDTFFATLINFPLQFILITIAFGWQLTAFQTTLFITSVMFTIAVARKYYIRLYFHKKYKKKQEKG
jgi:hypothetical protein